MTDYSQEIDDFVGELLAQPPASVTNEELINYKKQARTLLASAETEARIDERKKVALDNYQGHTFSESTNWKYKFQKFESSNERRLAQLKQRGKE